MYKKTAQKKEYTPDVAIGYIKESKNVNKKTGQKTRYMSLMIRLAELEKLPVDNGVVYLAGFKIEEKSSDKTPDYRFIGGTSNSKSAARKAAPAQTNIQDDSSDDSSPF